MISRARRRSAIALSLACALSMGACSGTGQEDVDSASTKTVAEEATIEEVAQPSARVIGDQASAATKVALSYGLNSKATALSLRGSEAEFGPDLLQGQPLAEGDEATLCVPEAFQTFDIRLTTADGTHEFLQIPIKDTSELRLAQVAEAIVLQAVDAAGVEVTISESAPAPLEAQQAEEPETDVEEAPVNEQVAYEDEGQAQPSYEESEPYYADAPYEEPAYDGYVEPTYDVPMEAPSAEDQTADTCIDDVVLKP